MTNSSNLIPLNKYHILNQFNLSNRNYYYKLKKALSKYKEHLIKLGRYNYLIADDQELIKDIFSTTRKPNKNNVKAVKEYMLNSKFDYVGCIHPRRAILPENIERIEYIFKQIIKETKPTYCHLFYTIEENKNKHNQYSEKHTHIHFLVQTDANPFLNKTKDILRIYSDSKVFLEPYDYMLFNNAGTEYILKNITEDSISDNCSYLSYTKRK
jgi:hypothetical protein